MHVRWCERKYFKASGGIKQSPKSKVGESVSTDDEGDAERDGLEEEDFEEGEDGNYGAGDGQEEGDEEEDEEGDEGEGEGEGEDDDAEEEEVDEESDDGASYPYNAASSSSSSSSATEGVFTHSLLNPSATTLGAAGD